jgi:hypothetical protein
MIGKVTKMRFIPLAAGCTIILWMLYGCSSGEMSEPTPEQTPAPTPIPGPPGSTCSVPCDVSEASFPFQVTGTFDDDPEVGVGCDSSPTNTVWFSYSPSGDGSYTINLANNTVTSAYSRIAVLETTSCGPYGSEISCTTSTSKSISDTVTLTNGVTYLIMFFTDDALYTMVDPVIEITKN